jgi:hypothetical protein
MIAGCEMCFELKHEIGQHMNSLGMLLRLTWPA